ncbi:3-methyladenine DNA glycosylase [Haloferula helveola]|uniref:Putative 3-methyladenine DNA glycosylase n=1 Tax=Haloferula helveola TaxID=490095 RepID=A0ABM7RHB7_9BACT|nr:3-methyladenine DNA glycosylase [Haloferula helveola]
MSRIDCSFFERDPATCARELIGATFQWDESSGRIVETEAYFSEDDPACHTFFRPSARRFVEEKAPGTAYVYLNYGVHWLFNVLVKGPDGAGFVLFRALEPLRGVDHMEQRRGQMPRTQLCAGPGCLTRALGIDGGAHGANFLGSERRLISLAPAKTVVTGSRIGISRGLELQWRFGERGHPCLSRKFGQ